MYRFQYIFFFYQLLNKKKKKETWIETLSTRNGNLFKCDSPFFPPILLVYPKRAKIQFNREKRVFIYFERLYHKQIENFWNWEQFWNWAWLFFHQKSWTGSFVQKEISSKKSQLMYHKMNARNVVVDIKKLNKKISVNSRKKSFC